MKKWARQNNKIACNLYHQCFISYLPSHYWVEILTHDCLLLNNTELLFPNFYYFKCELPPLMLSLGHNCENRLHYFKHNIRLAVCYYHVTYYTFQNESTLYSCLNVKELLARNRRDIWSLSDCNGIRTYNHLVRKQSLNHLAKLVIMASLDKRLNGWVFVYELSCCELESRCCHLRLALEKLWAYWSWYKKYNIMLIKKSVFVFYVGETGLYSNYYVFKYLKHF